MAKLQVSAYTEAEEQKQVRRDMVRVIVLNAVFFGILVGLFFWNRSTGEVDKFFQTFLKFS